VGDHSWQFSGDPAQQAVNGAPWLGAGQRATGLYSVPERPQHNSPLNQASVNQIQPQRRIPTPQQSFVPSVTPQSDLAQMSPHVSGNSLPFNGALAQIPGAPPQPPPQAPHHPSEQTIQCSKLPPLPEDRFKVLFAQFANTTGVRLNNRDFVVDGRPVNPWALHRAVFARNGFDSVCPRSLLIILSIYLFLSRLLQMMSGLLSAPHWDFPRSLQEILPNRCGVHLL